MVEINFIIIKSIKRQYEKENIIKDLYYYTREPALPKPTIIWRQKQVAGPL